MLGSLTIPLFPLKTVLFQGGYLPLRIFEPRYLKMIKSCQETDTGFGVVLISEGEEVETKQSSEPEICKVGTLAEIITVENLEDEQLAVFVTGGAKFQVEANWMDGDLMMGEVKFLPPEPTNLVRDEDKDLVAVLQFVMNERGVPKKVQETIDLTDERELSLRLADFLPTDVELQQALLQMDLPRVRLRWLRNWFIHDDDG